MRTLTLALFVLFIQIDPSGAQQNSICGDVLKSNVFDTRSTSTFRTFASDFQKEVCRFSWDNVEDIRNSANKFGLSANYLSFGLGIDDAHTSSTSFLHDKKSQFCSKTANEIAASSAFYDEFRNSDVAVHSWADCVKSTALGIFASERPNADLSGALIYLAKRDTGTLPPLHIDGVQSSGSNDVTCLVNGQNAIGYQFKNNNQEQAITCLKRPDADVSFIIQTNWGTYGHFDLPGYSKSISDLQLSIDNSNRQVSARLDALQGALAKEKQASLKACRVCFKQGVTGDEGQCKWPDGTPPNHVTCSGWASEGAGDPAWTQAYGDDTDSRAGWCIYQWKVECHASP